MEFKISVAVDNGVTVMSFAGKVKDADEAAKVVDLIAADCESIYGRKIVFVEPGEDEGDEAKDKLQS